jgi:thiol-disulfide isomerase/thioredoxin
MDMRREARSLTALAIAAAAALATMASAPAARAELTAGTPAPDFPRGKIWIGSPPLSMARELKGKVVLIDFWEYTCINCIRTLPALKRLYARYHPYGLEIVGVHAPEFDFAYRAENVRTGTARLRIPWPVVVDSDFSIWRAYDSNTWPNKFLVGANGIIVRQHGGEGAYGATERLIQAELKRRNPKLVFPPTFNIAADANDFDPGRCGAMSEETYVGAKRGGWWGAAIANREGFRPDKVVLYTSAPRRVKRGFAAHGLWKNNPDDLEHARASRGRGDYISIRCRGREVYAVMNVKTGGAARVEVTRDGAPVPAGRRGVDVRADAAGRTWIDVREGRMYYVIQDEDDAEHEIRLCATSRGIAINSFTFGNRCLTNFERL